MGNGGIGSEKGPLRILCRLVALALGWGMVACLVAGSPFEAAGHERLSEAERRQLEQGVLIVQTREVQSYPWPEVRAYRRVLASPEEVMAVYADFESQAGYFPNLVESRIVRRLSPTSFHVSYEYEVAGPNERYTVLAAVSLTATGFRMTWDLVRARYMRRLSGHMNVERFGSAALIEYTNRVDPGFFGIRLGSPETTVRQLRQTVEALANHVEWLRVAQPAKLEALVRALRSVLSTP